MKAQDLDLLLSTLNSNQIIRSIPSDGSFKLLTTSDSNDGDRELWLSNYKTEERVSEEYAFLQQAVKKSLNDEKLTPEERETMVSLFGFFKNFREPFEVEVEKLVQAETLLLRNHEFYYKEFKSWLNVTAWVLFINPIPGSLLYEMVLTEIESLEKMCAIDALNTLEQKYTQSSNLKDSISELNNVLYKSRRAIATFQLSGIKATLWPKALEEFSEHTLQYLESKQRFPTKPKKIAQPAGTLRDIFANEYKEYANMFFEILKDSEFEMIDTKGQWNSHKTDCRAYFDELKYQAIIKKDVKASVAAKIFKAYFGVNEGSFEKAANPSAKKKAKIQHAIELTISNIPLKK